MKLHFGACSSWFSIHSEKSISSIDMRDCLRLLRVIGDSLQLLSSILVAISVVLLFQYCPRYQ